MWKIYRTSTDISDIFLFVFIVVNNKYEFGEWLMYFTEVTLIALKKKPETTKCSNHCTISHITHTVKIVARILTKRIERKIEDVLGEVWIQKKKRD
jgi:hypothetical protein